MYEICRLEAGWQFDGKGLVWEMALLIELPPREDVLRFNRERWAEVVANEELAKVPGKIETNRHGQILMSPPPSGRHSSRKSRILRKLDHLLGASLLLSVRFRLQMVFVRPMSGGILLSGSRK
jgi:hypothetical protein